MDQLSQAPKEYSITVNTDNIHEAVSSVASALYALVEEALASHEDHVAEECEFELFARDVLGVLMRHAEQFTSANADWDAADNNADFH